MKGISDFLAKFKVIPNPKDEKRIIASIIVEEIKFNIEKIEDCIEVKDSSIQLDIHPAFKSLIFQRKNDILVKVNKRFNGEKFFNTIY